MHRWEARTNCSSEKERIFMFVLWQEVWASMPPVASWTYQTCSNCNRSWHSCIFAASQTTPLCWLWWIVYRWIWSIGWFSDYTCLLTEQIHPWPFWKQVFVDAISCLLVCNLSDCFLCVLGVYLGIYIWVIYRCCIILSLLGLHFIRNYFLSGIFYTVTN